MYKYIRLPFEAALVDDTFQKKIDELFNDIPNVLALLMILYLQILMQMVEIMM